MIPAVQPAVMPAVMDVTRLSDSLSAFAQLLAIGLILLALAPVVLGFITTVFITLFQIQDSTLPAVTRISAIFATSVLFGELVIDRLIQFATEMFQAGARAVG